MNEQIKLTLIIIVSVIVGVGAFTYGALTANPDQKQTSVVASTPKPAKIDLTKQLQTERSTIIGVLTSAYPKISSDYTIADGKLYNKGEWYGTTLTYHGKDTLSRDTLRVLMQKKQGLWILRTTPPRLLLSTVEFPDVPKSILTAINQPVSLPAGSEN
ncbi:MAG: hypothetical protein H6797_00020 [Candidatus Nomurabacteria bacterium]|nr:MAG: hypothetical protein H6797_00020 [Candidatus Nomurabacteria bacterium]